MVDEVGRGCHGTRELDTYVCSVYRKSGLRKLLTVSPGRNRPDYVPTGYSVRVIKHCGIVSPHKESEKLQLSLLGSFVRGVELA